MTQEEKAKAYDEALKVIKGNLNALNEITETGAETVNIQSIKNCFYRAFPELKESEGDSEDEKIRKKIISAMSYYRNDGCISEYEFGVCRNWLEKQKGQKPVEYLSKEKVYHIVSELTNLSLSGIIPIESEGYPKIVEIKSNVLKLLDYPIEQKPIEWSEEDERMLSRCIKSVECSKQFAKSETYKAAKDVEMNWLKSLRPQPHTVSIKDTTKFGNLEYERGVKDGIQYAKIHQWKPSEEQMEALSETIAFAPDTFKPKCTLMTLQNDLKKLMEE